MSRRALLCVLLGLGAACGPARAAPAFVAPPGDSVPSAARADSLAAPAPDTLPLALRPVQEIGRADSGTVAPIEPVGLATDAFGRIYVTDAAQHRLVRFDARGVWLGEAGALGSGVGELRRPAGVAMMGALGVAVLDRENRRVALYDLFGRLTGVLADLAALEEDLGRVDPVALAADRGGTLYIADAERDRVLVMDFTGAYVRSLGGYGAAAGSFRGLCALASGRHGELVTAERTGARIQWLDAGGSPLATWSLPAGTARRGIAIAVDDSARVAVADEGGGTLWLYGSGGRLLGVRAGLATPRALAFAPDGSLLVAEAAAGRVRRFVLESAGTTTPPGR